MNWSKQRDGRWFDAVSFPPGRALAFTEKRNTPEKLKDQSGDGN